MKNMESRKRGQKDKCQLTAKGDLTGFIVRLKPETACRVEAIRVLRSTTCHQSAKTGQSSCNVEPARFSFSIVEDTGSNLKLDGNRLLRVFLQR